MVLHLAVFLSDSVKKKRVLVLQSSFYCVPVGHVDASKTQMKFNWAKAAR